VGVSLQILKPGRKRTRFFQGDYKSAKNRGGIPVELRKNEKSWGEKICLGRCIDHRRSKSGEGRGKVTESHRGRLK